MRAIESKLSDPEIFKSDEGIALSKEYQELKKKVKTKTEAWEVLYSSLED